MNVRLGAARRSLFRIPPEHPASLTYNLVRKHGMCRVHAATEDEGAGRLPRNLAGFPVSGEALDGKGRMEAPPRLDSWWLPPRGAGGIWNAVGVSAGTGYRCFSNT